MHELGLRATCFVVAPSSSPHGGGVQAVLYEMMI